MNLQCHNKIHFSLNHRKSILLSIIIFGALAVPIESFTMNQQEESYFTFLDLKLSHFYRWGGKGYAYSGPTVDENFTLGFDINLKEQGEIDEISLLFERQVTDRYRHRGKKGARVLFRTYPTKKHLGDKGASLIQLLRVSKNRLVYSMESEGGEQVLLERYGDQRLRGWVTGNGLKQRTKKGEYRGPFHLTQDEGFKSYLYKSGTYPKTKGSEEILPGESHSPILLLRIDYKNGQFQEFPIHYQPWPDEDIKEKGQNKALPMPVIIDPFSSNEVVAKVGEIEKIIDRRREHFYRLQKRNMKTEVRQIQGFHTVVPVSREFYNGNIPRLALSLLKQKNLNSRPLKLNVVFVVNNTEDTENSVKKENLDTIAFLRGLQKGKVVGLPNELKHLEKPIEKALPNSQMNIEIVDKVVPGLVERNIGKIRNLGIQQIFDKVASQERDAHLVTHLDADTYVSPSYMADVVKIFSRKNLDWALFDLKFGLEMGSDERIYRRMITAELRFAYFAFVTASNWDLPVSGTPRVASTLKVLKEVGGFSPMTEGEDTDLVAKLRDHFTLTGQWHPEIQVITNYRARADGYDSAYYLKSIDEPVEPPVFVSKAIPHLNDITERLRRHFSDPVFDLIYEEYLAEGRKKAEDRRNELQFMLNYIAVDEKLNYFGDDPLFFSSWLPRIIDDAYEASNGNLEETMSKVTNSFPHLLSPEPQKESRLLAQILTVNKLLQVNSGIRSISELPVVEKIEPVYEPSQRAIRGDSAYADVRGGGARLSSHQVKRASQEVDRCQASMEGRRKSFK